MTKKVVSAKFPPEVLILPPDGDISWDVFTSIDDLEDGDQVGVYRLVEIRRVKVTEVKEFV